MRVLRSWGKGLVDGEPVDPGASMPHVYKGEVAVGGEIARGRVAWVCETDVSIPEGPGTLSERAKMKGGEEEVGQSAGCLR